MMVIFVEMAIFPLSNRVLVFEISLIAMKLWQIPHPGDHKTMVDPRCINLHLQVACLSVIFLILTEPFIPGYQRQLNYKHQDGSYSTFGEQYSRNQGNTW